MNKPCLTCKNIFEAKRKDSIYCSRICYRRDPIKAKIYSDRTNAYQKSHSRELSRRFKKLKYKCNHEKISLEINFEIYQNLIPLGCTYCGKTIEQETGCSLDRIDSNLGYTTSNVTPCCGSCNQIKNVHLTYEEMKVAMKAILEYRREQANV